MVERWQCRKLVSWLSLLAAPFIAAGCAGNTATSQTGSGGNGGGGAGGAAVVAAGTCGVSRRIPIAGSPPNAVAIERVGDDFVIGPWDAADGTPTPLHWGLLEPSGPTLTPYTAGAGSVFRQLELLNIGRADQLVVISAGGSDPSSAGETLYQSALVRNGEVAAAPPVTLVSAFFRGTIQHAAVAALDGQQGLFMIGHIAVEDPTLAVVGPDGARAGDVGVMTTSGNWSCAAALPTAHAGAFFLVDGAVAPATVETFHLIAMAPSGGVALEARMPLDRAAVRVGDNFLPPCPLVALAADGFAFLSYETTAAGGGTWHLHRIGPDGTVADELWDTLPGSPLALAMIGDSAVAVCAAADGTATIVKRTGGQDQRFPLAQADVGTVIPSQAGTLFLRGQAADAGGSATNQIVELRCP